MENLAIFQTLYHALPMGVILFNQDAEILSLNALGQKILALPKPWPGLLTVFPLSSQELLALPTHPEEWRETKVSLPERKPLYLKYQTAPLRTGEGPFIKTLGLCLFHDVTSEVLARQERERHLQITSVAHLLPSIAHEFKNPLAGIRSMIEVILEETQMSEHQDDLRLILEEIERMRWLVDRMRLILPEKEGGEPVWPIDLASEVDRVIQLCTRRAKHQGIALSVTGERPCYVHLDQEMIFLTLLNLVTNAMDACSREDAVTVSFVRSDSQVSLIVSDTGRGMSPDVLRRLSEPFFSTKQGGSGIGLALVHKVIERWGGEISLASEEGHGTQVLLSLPERIAGSSPLPRRTSA